VSIAIVCVVGRKLLGCTDVNVDVERRLKFYLHDISPKNLLTAENWDDLPEFFYLSNIDLAVHY
jgi:hypothetical protein